MTKCYEMLNTILTNTWDQTPAHCEAQNSHVLLVLLYYAGLHWIMQEEASTSFKLSCQASVYLSCSCFGCCMTTESSDKFPSSTDTSYQANWKRKFQGHPTKLDSHALHLGPTMCCIRHPLPCVCVQKGKYFTRFKGANMQLPDFFKAIRLLRIYYDIHLHFAMNAPLWAGYITVLKYSFAFTLD